MGKYTKIKAVTKTLGVKSLNQVRAMFDFKIYFTGDDNFYTLDGKRLGFFNAGYVYKLK